MELTVDYRSLQRTRGRAVARRGNWSKEAVEWPNVISFGSWLCVSRLRFPSFLSSLLLEFFVHNLMTQLIVLDVIFADHDDSNMHSVHYAESPTLFICVNNTRRVGEGKPSFNNTTQGLPTMLLPVTQDGY